VNILEDAMLGTLRKTGLVLDAVQLAEKLSVMPTDIERAAKKLIANHALREFPGPFGMYYAASRATRSGES
jgi:hypothetical protein